MESNVRRLAAVALLLLSGVCALSAQDIDVPTDSLATDSLAAAILPVDSISQEISLIVDTTATTRPAKDWTAWRPNPQRALWLALVIPGGGQIYNRKYWKLPLVYGGFIGCLYAMSWNNSQYKDYSQAYLDIMDDDPGTASYNQFLHLGVQITSANEEQYKSIFKKRKDKFRRWRDMSFFILCGVYALSVIDAYVDAELSVFDISKDLSLKVEPTIINDGSSRNPFESAGVGIYCCVNF